MTRSPGAVVAGTGLDVWEVIATWRQTGEEFAALQRKTRAPISRCSGSTWPRLRRP